MLILIQEGHHYIATPPLYKCTYKKVSEYCYTEQQRQAFIDKYVAGDEEPRREFIERNATYANIDA